MSEKAFITLLANEGYLATALNMFEFHREAKSKYPMILMLTSGVPQKARDVIKRSGIETIDVEPLLPERHDIGITEARFLEAWSKLRIFELFDYDRLIFLDADGAMLKNMDELFDLELKPNEMASTHACACNPRKIPHYPADWIPENCGYTPLTYPECLIKGTDPNTGPRPHGLLNSGLIVVGPTRELYAEIKDFLDHSPMLPELKFPDQDLLATVFKGRWISLPYIYNALKTLKQIHAQVWRDEDVKFLHFILRDKPWHDRPPPPGSDEEYEACKLLWWAKFDPMMERWAKEGRQEDVAYLESLVAPKRT